MVSKKLNLLIIVSIMVIALAITGFAVVQNNQSLEDELAGLTQELNSQGYSWLVDYSQIDLNTKKRIMLY